MPPGYGVGGELARGRLLGLVVAAGTIAPPGSGAARAMLGLQLARSHAVNNILAARRWPWV